MWRRALFIPLLAFLALTSCETTSQREAAARAQMMLEIQNEPPGNYFIGRRYYKSDYKFWGYIRRPGQPWSTAVMVMLDENRCLAPDRAAGTLGIDNGSEYILHGHFSGTQVYEPASNGFYPAFVLTSYKLKTATPAPIFSNQQYALDPKVRMILKPL